MAKGGQGGNGGGGISGNKRDNFLNGTENADLIEGNGGDDTLEGLGGNDTLNGGTGNDSLIGGLGDDIVDGGSGTDSVVLSGNRIDYSITQIDATTVEIAGPDGTDTVTNVESFQFADMTQSFADLSLPLFDVAVSSIALNSTSDLDLGRLAFGGGSGAQLVVDVAVENLGVMPASGVSVSFYLSTDGTLSGDDLLLGSEDVPTASGTQSVTGSYTVPLSVLAGDYTVIAVASSTETDVFVGNNIGTMAVTLVGGRLPGTDGDDLFVGTDYNDIAEGGLGNDIFVSSAGVDRFYGDSGTDTADYSSFGQGIELLGGLAAEIVQVGGVTNGVLYDVERFVATDFDDDLSIMNSGLDWVDGGAGNDTLLGSSGNDTLLGGAGDDRIQVLLGSDSVDGGVGLDTVVLTGNRKDFVVTQIDADTVEIAGPAYGSDVKIVSGVEVFDFWDVSQSFSEAIVPLDPNVAASAAGLSETTLIAGEALSAYWYVFSDGGADADTSTTELVIASAPDVAQVIERFGVTETGILATGTSASFTGILDTTGFAPGTYYIASIADSAEVLDESNEADNISNWTQVVIEAQQVDYSLDAVTVLPSSELNLNVATPGYGEPIPPAGMLNLSLTVSNNSNFGPTEYEVSLFLSADNVLSGDDLQLDTGDALGGTVTYTVNFGQTIDIAVNAELSEFLQQGDYHVIAVINEFSTSNDPNLPLDNPDDNILATAAPITLVGGWTYGTEGNDLFVGNEYRETFQGNGGDDTLTGDVFGDVFDGGDGVDTLDLSAMTFGLVATGGPDETYGTGIEIRLGVTTLYGGGEEPPVGFADNIERIVGSDFDDGLGAFNSNVTYLDGGAGNDQLVGSFGDDTLIGGLGDDFLFGNLGDDQITSGDGNDMIYAVSSDAYGIYSPNGHDIVKDFDVAMDMLLILYNPQIETFDPFANLTQTAEGALVTMSPDASILLQGVDVFDLNLSNLTGYEDTPYTETYG